MYRSSMMNLRTFFTVGLVSATISAAVWIGAADRSSAGSDAKQKALADLDNPAPNVRTFAVETIEDSVSVADIPALRKALKDPVREVKGFAARALGKLGPAAKEALPELLHNLDDPDGWVEERTMAALALVGPAAKPAVPQLIRILKTGPVGAQTLAVQTLAFIDPNNPEVTAALGEAETKMPNIISNDPYYTGQYRDAVQFALDPVERDREILFIHGHRAVDPADFKAFERLFTPYQKTNLHFTVESTKSDRSIKGRALIPVWPKNWGATIESPTNPWGFGDAYYAVQKLPMPGGRSGYIVDYRLYDGTYRGITLYGFEPPNLGEPKEILLANWTRFFKGAKGRSESWIVDLNGDNLPDIIVRERVWSGEDEASAKLSRETYTAYISGAKDYDKRALTEAEIQKLCTDPEP